MQKKEQSQSGRGTEEYSPKRSPSLSPISFGTNEKKILLYLQNLGKNRFNRNQCERDTHIPRTTIKRTLDRLARKGFVTKTSLTGEPGGYSIYSISDNGISALEVISGQKQAVHCFRGGSPKDQNLSVHWHDFKLKISERSEFSIQRIKRQLKPDSILENFIPNLYQIFAKFIEKTGEIVVIVNPKQVIIRVHEIIVEDTDTADLFSFQKAMEYREKLETVGLMTDSMSLEAGHWARIGSVLSTALQKIDDKYFIDLGDGRKFWIDSSHGLEDETNAKDLRDSIDNLILDLGHSQSRFSDIDKLKDAVRLLAGTAASLIKLQLPDQLEHKPEGRPDYFG